MPVIDGTASTVVTVCHCTPIRSAEPSILIRAELLFTSLLSRPIGTLSIQYRSEASLIGCGLRPRAFIQPSLDDAFKTGSSGKRPQWT
ncbi:hypothetical protein B0T12DRAFT_426354 [Alternaria alternata]|nr:hypothetical protein B0T12DRAFT_426354 [Alternaria alternata]